MLTPDMTLLGRSELGEAERLRSRLARRGVSLEIIHNALTCTKGCAITVEMWAKAEDLGAIDEELAAQAQERLAGLTFDPNVINQVYDPDQDTAVCPACATTFATSHKECPDCGLVFSP